MAKYSPPPGTSDIFPEEISDWTFIEDRAREIFRLYGYGEIRTPSFEFTEVFQKGLGDETEVVRKEMYTFEDRGGRSLTLRPEGTAGVMRALAGTDVLNGVSRKVFYMGPMFRGERPAAGRRRQFHQIGVENAGGISAEEDAECMAMLMHYVESLGISGARLLLNTRGVASERGPLEKALRDYFSERISSMCDDCAERIKGNLWRILDCKNPACADIVSGAPPLLDFFSTQTVEYYREVREKLDTLGVEYEESPRLVRGLDYYVHTVFELIHPELGGQDAIAGGGRYEFHLPGLKKPIPGVGFALGIERIIMVRKALGLHEKAVGERPVFLAAIGEKAMAFNLEIARELRSSGIPVLKETESKSMKAQMRAANRVNAKYTVITGEDEIGSGRITCRDMDTGEEESVLVDDLSERLKCFTRLEQ